MEKKPIIIYVEKNTKMLENAEPVNKGWSKYLHGITENSLAKSIKQMT